MYGEVQISRVLGKYQKYGIYLYGKTCTFFISVQYIEKLEKKNPKKSQDNV